MPGNSTDPLHAAVCVECLTATSIEKQSYDRWRRRLGNGRKSLQDWRNAVVDSLSKAKRGARTMGGRLTAEQAESFRSVASGLTMTSGGFDGASDLAALNSGVLPGLESYGSAENYNSHVEPIWKYLDAKGLAVRGSWDNEPSVIGTAPDGFEYVVIQEQASQRAATVAGGGPLLVDGQPDIGIGIPRRNPGRASPDCIHTQNGYMIEGSSTVRVGVGQDPMSRVGDSTSDGSMLQSGDASTWVGGAAAAPMSSTKEKKPGFFERLFGKRTAKPKTPKAPKTPGGSSSGLLKGPDPGLKPKGASENWSGAVLKRDPPKPNQDPRQAPGSLHLYEAGKYVGYYRANENGFMRDLNGKLTRGVPTGSYTLQPKKNDGIRFKKGQPAITGKGQPIGKPGAGYKPDAILLHNKEAPGIPDSLACVTIAQDGVDRVTNMMNGAPGKALPFIVK